jgi:tRNA threonylcarbamoyladenosine biosynthesis protein TsaB
MRVLAIETSGRDVAAAVGDEGGPISCLTVRSGRRHAELLHPLVQQACELAAVTLAELDAIAVDVGPGLFTGIRVGVAAAKGFASALGIPVVALTSLEIIRRACEAASPGPGRSVVPVVDLRRGDVAWSLAAGPACFGSPEQLAALLGSLPPPVVLAGDGALRYASVLAGGASGDEGSGSPQPPGGREGGRAAVAGAELASPPVASLAVRAVTELEAGRAVDPLSVVPVYLREADARINWTTRHGAPAFPVPGAEGH